MYYTKLGVKTIARTFHRFVADLDARINFIPEEHKFNKINKLQEKGVLQ
jgi:hypothetical protein